MRVLLKAKTIVLSWFKTSDFASSANSQTGFTLLAKDRSRNLLHRSKLNLNGKRLRLSQAGFTLIELVLVLAISSLLAVVLLSSYSAQQNRQRFTDAMERITTNLEQVKNEANTTVNSRSNGGSDQIHVAAGKLVTFNGSQLLVETLRLDNLGAPTNPAIVDSRTIDIPWGIQFDGSNPNDTVGFVRATGSSENAILKIYFMPSSVKACPTCGTSYATDATAPSVYTFEDPEHGFRARVTISPSGTINLKYLN